MHLRDERGAGRVFEREDRHGITRGTWIVPVGRVQQWRQVAATVTAVVAAAVTSVVFECRGEQQLGREAVAEGFAWLELESRRRTEDRGQGRKWREVVCEEVARKFTNSVQDVIYVCACGCISTISTRSERRRDVEKW